MMLALLMSAALWSPAFADTKPEAPYVPSAELSVAEAALAGQGFTCTAPTAHTALLCTGSLEGGAYPRPLAILVPPHYRLGDRAEIVLHLHGYVGDDTPLDDTLNDFHFERMFPWTHRNAVLVIPASVGPCTTYRDWLMPARRFKAFLASLTELLAKAALSRRAELKTLVVSGHSGAYRAIEAIVEHSPELVSEVFLFDSLYNDGAAFVKHMGRPPGIKLLSVFIPLKEQKTGAWKWTAKGNFLFWKSLNPTADDGDFLAATLAPDTKWETLREQYEAASPVLLRSDVDHMETVRKYFARALRVR